MTHSKTVLQVQGCLFDMDGTLLFTTKAVEEMYKELCKEYKLDEATVLDYVHGVRTVEVMNHFLPDLHFTLQDASNLEATIPKKWIHLARDVPGSRQLLKSLPAGSWGIVTSATHPVADIWLVDYLKITLPQVFLTAQDVKKGKPDPEGYLKGISQLLPGVKDPKFLVFEDAPAGIQAGVNAEATVIGLATTFTAEVCYAAGAHYVVKDLDSVHFLGMENGVLNIELSDIIPNTLH